jgi:hypothetical protein
MTLPLANYRIVGEKPQATRRSLMFALATDYPFLDIMWTMFIFFAWMIWISLIVLVFVDNFRRQDHSGWAKAGWTVFVIFAPLVGALVYMIARPKDDLAAV